MPGSHIYVKKYDRPLTNEADYVFLGAWNFKDEIIDELVASGYQGKFIIPLPGDPKKI